MGAPFERAVSQSSISYRLSPGGGGTLRFSAVAPNVQAISAAARVRAVTISLSDGDPQAMIFYTTDGSTPDSRAKRYTGPMHLALSRGETLQITAAAILPSGRTSTTTTLVLRRR